MRDKHNDGRLTTRNSIIRGAVFVFSRRERFVDEVGWVTMNVRAEDSYGRVVHFWTKETFHDYGRA